MSKKKYDWTPIDYLALGSLALGLGFVAVICVGAALKYKKESAQREPSA